MNIKLPILFDSENTNTLESLGLGFDLNDADVRETIFYSINGISPYLEQNKDYTTIYSNGYDFICTLNINEVERLIKENKAIYAN